eukprot:5354703-Prymnesium_polylepis.1
MFVLETDSYGQQKLAVTRSLGDYYMQYHGATWEPAVSCIDLFDVSSQLKQITLVIGSDGLWDLWAYKDVLEYPLAAGVDVESSLKQLVEVHVGLNSWFSGRWHTLAATNDVVQLVTSRPSVSQDRTHAAAGPISGSSPPVLGRFRSS